MNKTPVSILHEMSAKKKITPTYELIYDGGGSHMNTFTYQVSCDGLSATGTGRSKKDAKHEAAKAMLETIAAHNGYPQLPASPAQSPVRTPLPPVVPASPRIPPTVPFVDAIGALQDLCANNNLQEPEYLSISEVGPPHAKTFTYECRVSTFRETGVATKKKLAKHEAAKKMLDRIRELLGDEELDSESREETERRVQLLNQTAKARYPELTKQPFVYKKVNLGLKISEYHCKLRNSLTEVVRINALQRFTSMLRYEPNQNLGDLLEELLGEFEDILSSLNLEYTMVDLMSKQDTTCVVGLKIVGCVCKTRIGFGKTKTEAQFNTLLNMVDNLIQLLT